MGYKEELAALPDDHSVYDYLMIVPGGQTILMDLITQDDRGPGEPGLCDLLGIPGLKEEYEEINKKLHECLANGTLPPLEE